MAAYQQALDSGHPDAVSLAALGLGILLREQGEVAAAKAAWQQATHSDRAEISDMARRLLDTLR